MTNTQNPWGSTSYNQTGTNSFTDSSGKVTTVPQFTQTTTYDPAHQAIFDKTTQAQNNLAQLAQDQSGRLNDSLANPFTFNNQDAADWSYDLAQTRIAPQQQAAQKQLESRLINSGIRPGTAAWNSEMQRLTNANTDQNNQLALNGRSQAFGEALQTRQEPLNELTALLSGSQVANPGTQSPGTPQTQVGGVDYTGLVNNNYNQQVASNNALMGGLFGLAGTGATAAIKYSDCRVKTDILRVGSLPNGLPLYSFRYVWGGPMDVGVMAQDVERLIPSAVTEDANGIKMVDYAQVLPC